MAKRVSVAELQAMSRGSSIDETEIIDPVTEDAAATEALRRIGAPVNGKGQAIHLTDTEVEIDGEMRPVAVRVPADLMDGLVRDEGVACSHAVLELHGICTACGEFVGEDKPDAMTRLVAREMPLLDVGASCTAEMSLHMITERVRDAVLATDWGKLATDAEIVAEAERIWVSLDRKRSHTYSVELDGTVRDWRRPDTTPDRGDVTELHTLTDDEPRFSGGGDGQAEGRDLYAVPTDAQFNGKLYRDAPDLANRAETLIERHGFLSDLVNCEIRYFWKRKTGVSKGRVKIGYCKRASDLLGHFTGADFIVWLSATTARDGKFTDTQVEAALFHQLLHIGTDDSGNFIFAPHDFEGFGAEIRHYGTWTEDLKLGGTAFVAAHQMGLFDSDEDEGLEDESGGPMHAPMRDGAGVLIHADGEPMSADEIEAMERHELADDDDEYEDYARDSAAMRERAAADPDGDSPEDEDVLADPAVI